MHCDRDPSGDPVQLVGSRVNGELLCPLENGIGAGIRAHLPEEAIWAPLPG